MSVGAWNTFTELNMLRKKKLTKNVWYEDELWKVREVVSPNQFQDFLILEKIDEESLHEGDIAVVEMCCIESQNYEWYPDTKKVRKALEEKLKAVKKVEEIKRDNGDILTRSWLDTMHPD